ncbi:MAG: type II secretion system protein [Bacilli bacterium]|nr:type II secretion system protein [Bacilli bacterium]
MNKRGFTLVELLAVIVIIGALLALSTLGVTKLIRDNEEKLKKQQCAELKEAAINYYNYEDEDEGQSGVDVSYLIKKGFYQDSKNFLSDASKSATIDFRVDGTNKDLIVDMSSISECKDYYSEVEADEDDDDSDRDGVDPYEISGSKISCKTVNISSKEHCNVIARAAMRYINYEDYNLNEEIVLSDLVNEGYLSESVAKTYSGYIASISAVEIKSCTNVRFLDYDDCN